MPSRRDLVIVAAIAIAGLAALTGCGSGGQSSTTTGASGSDLADGLEAKYTAVVTNVSPHVVEIRTSNALGSGIVYDSHGDVVTNAHVVGSSKKVTVRLPDGSTHPGTVVGTSTGNDLAVVRLAGATPKPAAFADSSKVQVGD